jgi:arabinose-5-phosphate isomerase
MLKELLEKERKILNHFFDHLDLNTANKLLEILIACNGLIIITGVGKSGLVAEKIAQTLTSTGSRAFFLSPANAMHGDIGIVSKNDVFLMISKSGESDELLQMIPFLRNRGVMPIAIVNNGNSRLAKACDLNVVLPMEKELCPFDLVPTTSSVMQMIFGDVLAVELMMHKNFSLIEYASNHPAGKIGRRLTLRVKDLMLKGEDVPLCMPADKLIDTLVELSNKRCGCVMIVDAHKKLLGIFTDGDLRRSLQKFGSKVLETTMSELMTKTARFIESQAMASDALALMEADQKHPITVLPVVDEEDKVVGLIKMHDIVQSGL